MGGMDRGGIIDAVAEKARDMTAVSQRFNDAFLLIRIDTREKIDLLDLCRKADIGELGDLGAGQNAFCANPTASATCCTTAA
jgi:hypothetical protein